MAHPEEEVRNQSAQLTGDLNDQRYKIFSLVQAFWMYRETSDEFPTLTKEDQMFINDTIDAYSDLYRGVETFTRIS